MLNLWLKGWLVKIEIESFEGIFTGSGIVINKDEKGGLILTCYHNVFGNSDKHHIIKTLTPSFNGSWLEQIPNSIDNITVQWLSSFLDLASDLDLILVKAQNASFKKITPPQIAQSLPEKDQPVILLTHDKNSTTNEYREEKAIINEVYQPKNGGGYYELSISMVNGIPGASGGGVFTQDGHLLGIIKHRRKDNKDYIATFVGDQRLKTFIPYTQRIVNQPNLKATTMDRRTLISQLNGLVPGQFEELLIIIKVPQSLIPPTSAEQAMRTSALLRWAESPTGCGLDKVQEVLQTILNPL